MVEETVLSCGGGWGLGVASWLAERPTPRARRTVASAATASGSHRRRLATMPMLAAMQVSQDTPFPCAERVSMRSRPPAGGVSASPCTRPICITRLEGEGALEGTDQTGGTPCLRSGGAWNLLA